MNHIKYITTALVIILSQAGCNPEKNTTASKTTSKTVEQTHINTTIDNQHNPNKNAYFGDLHIHTKNSFDAYIFNVRSTPDDVYRFAKGEGIRHPAGYDITLDGPPLDFVAATDHGAYMGILPQMHNPDSPLSKLDIAQDMFSTAPEKIVAAFGKMGGSVRSGVPYVEIYDRGVIDNTWQATIDAANRHYKPGKLTTFAAYEYTAVTVDTRGDGFVGGNLHRNVVFKDAAPDRLFATLDSVNPEDLWDWMDDQREQGRDVLAIPHNSNVSDGKMFDQKTYDGKALTADYARQRIRNEPIAEITQVKGTSETHPGLSPNDEFANFEIYEYLLSSQVKSKIRGSYIREALANGMMLEEKLGANPYKFGLIGSSDTHVAGGAFTEKNYWSKVGIIDGTPEARGSVPPGGAKAWEGVKRDENAEYWFSRWSASGLAAVWAEQNTREDIFAGMQAKETYATSGPRIKLRFFAGDYDENILSANNMISQAYAKGTAMGGDIEGHNPHFLVWAMRDPLGAPLDRIQIVKAWHTNGKAMEAVYDVTCSDGRIPDANNRCSASTASVNLEDCSISHDTGAPELKALWQDPDFNPTQKASYYVRVLENPTCRWSTWDALRTGTERHPDLAATLQDRAWSSPIWYNGQ